MKHTQWKRHVLGVGQILGFLMLISPTRAQPVQKTLFVSNNVSDNISVFTVNADGTLTEVTGSPFAAGEDTEALALTTDGKFLVATNAGLPVVEKIWLFQVDPTGALVSVPRNPWFTGNAPLDLDASPLGYIYSPCASDDQLRVFEIRGDSLVELPDSPHNTPDFPHEVDTAADGQYVYFSHLTAGVISGYAVGPGGGLSPLPGAPYALPGSGFELTVTPDGKHLYVALGLGNAVAGYSIEPDGSLVPLAGSPFDSGATSAVNLAVSPNGAFVFVAHVVSDGVTTMARDPDGQLTFVPGSFRLIGSDVRKIVADDRFVFVTDESSIDPGVGVMVYAYDAEGLLTLIPGSPFAAGSRPKDMELFVPVTSIPGDMDFDGDVDLDDYGLWEVCLAGPGIPGVGGCQEGDFDDDLDIDLGDFAVFQANFTGAGTIVRR
jgi:6-phosphogluconolactonase (cycloisomerase 2 family)